eukprot:939999-Prymnesium_polylepis.1
MVARPDGGLNGGSARRSGEEVACDRNFHRRHVDRAVCKKAGARRPAVALEAFARGWQTERSVLGIRDAVGAGGARNDCRRRRAER